MVGVVGVVSGVPVGVGYGVALGVGSGLVVTGGENSGYLDNSNCIPKPYLVI